MFVTLRLSREALPIILMIGLVPFVQNDYALSAVFVAIIGIALLIEYRRRDILLFAVGMLFFFLGETLFISTGVETFERRSLLGLMPLWLPLLWGYIFIALRRAVVMLNAHL